MGAGASVPGSDLVGKRVIVNSKFDAVRFEVLQAHAAWPPDVCSGVYRL